MYVSTFIQLVLLSFVLGAMTHFFGPLLTMLTVVFFLGVISLVSELGK